MGRKTIADLKSYVAYLNEHFPRLGMSHIVVSDLCDVRNALVSWPHAGNPGVYILLNEKHELLYIGKASCNTDIGHRLGAHFYANGKPKNSAFDAVRYLVTIPVPNDRAFEAPAIEEFLIAKLNPELCTIARSEPIAITKSE